MAHSRTVLAAVAVVFVAFLGAGVTGSIIGVDMGGEFIKVAVVKPGMPFQIATNPTSKRKTPNALGMYEGERLFGSDAAGLATRKPARIFTGVSRALGLNESHPVMQSFLNRDQPPYVPFKTSVNERGGLQVHLPDEHDGTPGQSFSAEEVTAQLLSHVKDFSEAFSSSSVRDCVLTVPSYWTQVERKSLLKSAELADLKVLALVEENTAAAVQFGIDRVYNETHYVLIHNVGSYATQSSIIAYDSYSKRELGRNKTIGTAKVVGKAWDTSFGGAHFDAVLVEFLANTFNEKHMKDGEDIRTVPRAMAKLKKAATRVKTMLSANKEFPVMIEALHNNVDFRVPIKRTQFEEMSADLLTRTTLSIEQALAQANITVADLGAVEVIGGGVRVPAVKKILTEFVNMPLSVHLNGDEAMALGAAFVAANRSTAFRVRKVGMVDTTPFPVSVRLTELPVEAVEEADEEADVEEAEEEAEEEAAPKKEWARRSHVFKNRNHMPSVKKIAFPHDKDIRVVLHYNTDEDSVVPAGIGETVAAYNVTGVSAVATGNYSHLGRPKVALSFQLDHNGVARLLRAEATYEEIVMPEPEPEPVEEASTADDAEGADAAKDGAEGDDKADDKADDKEAEEKADAEAEGADAEKADADGEKSEGDEDKQADDDDKAKAEDKKPEEKAEAKKPAKKKEKKPKKVVHRFPLKVSQDHDSLHMALLRGGSFAAAKRTLSDLNRADVLRAERAEARNGLESYVYATRDRMWSEEEAINAVTTEEQRTEVEELLSETSEWLDFDGEDAETAEFRTRKGSIESLMAPINERVSEAAVRDEVVETTTKLLTETKDLMALWETEKPQINETEREDVITLADDIKEWLDEQVAKQADTPSHEAPVFTKKAVGKKMSPLKALVLRLSRRPKPKPKVKVNATESNSTDTNSTDAEGDADAEGTDAEEAAEGDSDATGEEAADGEAEEGAADAAEEEAEADADGGDAEADDAEL